MQSSDVESTEYWQILKGLNVLVDAEVQMTSRGEDGVIRVIGAYKLWAEGELLKEELAAWDPMTGLTLLTTVPAAIRRWDLQGTRLPGTMVVSTRQDPFSFRISSAIVSRFTLF